MFVEHDIFYIEGELVSSHLASEHLQTVLKRFARVCGNLGADGYDISTAEALTVIGRNPKLKRILSGLEEELHTSAWALLTDLQDNDDLDVELVREAVDLANALDAVVIDSRMVA